jgi:hypothetical protein
MLDLARDYLLIDDPESITYYSKTGEGTYAAPRTIEYVQVGSITNADARTTPALLESDTCVFQVWRVPMGTDLGPKIGDHLTDARGKNWVVHRVQPSDRDATGYQRYRLTTISDV